MPLSEKTLARWAEIQSENTKAIGELRMDAAQWNASDRTRVLLNRAVERLNQASRLITRAIVAATED